MVSLDAPWTGTDAAPPDATLPDVVAGNPSMARCGGAWVCPACSLAMWYSLAPELGWHAIALGKADAVAHGAALGRSASIASIISIGEGSCICIDCSEDAMSSGCLVSCLPSSRSTSGQSQDGAAEHAWDPDGVCCVPDKVAEACRLCVRPPPSLLVRRYGSTSARPG